MNYTVRARRVDAHGSTAETKDAVLTLDTDMAGRRDAFNPVELLLAALAACIIKGIERVTPILRFSLRGVDVEVEAVRQDAPPLLSAVTYRIVVDTDESDHRLELLHANVRKFGTISNTLAGATTLEGTLVRKG